MTFQKVIVAVAVLGRRGDINHLFVCIEVVAGGEKSRGDDRHLVFVC